jgi:hypothetical protein
MAVSNVAVSITRVMKENLKITFVNGVMSYQKIFFRDHLMRRFSDINGQKFGYNSDSNPTQFFSQIY